MLHTLLIIHLSCTAYLLIHLAMVSNKFRSYIFDEAAKKSTIKVSRKTIHTIVVLSTVTPLIAQYLAVRILLGEIAFAWALITIKFMQLKTVIRLSSLKFNLRSVAIGYTSFSAPAGVVFQIHFILLHWIIVFPESLSIRKLLKEALIEHLKEQTKPNGGS